MFGFNKDLIRRIEVLEFKDKRKGELFITNYASSFEDFYGCEWFIDYLNRTETEVLSFRFTGMFNDTIKYNGKYIEVWNYTHLKYVFQLQGDDIVPVDLDLYCKAYPDRVNLPKGDSDE